MAKQKLQIIESKSRISINLVKGMEQIRVSPGEPVVLQGLTQDETWEDIVIVSSAGGCCAVKTGQYKDYRFEGDTNKRMTFKPPVVSASPGAKRKPKIIKTKAEED